MKRTPCGAHPMFDPRDLDRRPAAPFGASAPRSGCLPSCRAEPELPRTPLPRSLTCWKASRDTRTVLTSEPPRRAPARHTEHSSASAASSTCLAARRAGRTRDASDRLLPSHFFVPVPAPRRFSMRHALARLRDRGHRLLHISAIRFGGTHVCRGVTAVGVVFPSRCV